MATYFMFGRYSHESVKAISAERTDAALDVIEKFGGKVISGYALLGEHDLVIILDLPDHGQAIKTSVALSRLLGISFTTSPAVTMEEFDGLMDEL